MTTTHRSRKPKGRSAVTLERKARRKADRLRRRENPKRTPAGEARHRRFLRLAQYRQDKVTHEELIRKFVFRPEEEWPSALVPELTIRKAQHEYITAVRHELKSLAIQCGAFTDERNKFHDADPHKMLHGLRRIVRALPLLLVPTVKYVTPGFANVVHREECAKYIHHYEGLLNTKRED